MRNTTPDIFPKQDYSEKDLIPVTWLLSAWADSRILAWTFLFSSHSGLTKLERALAPVLPQLLLINLGLFILNLTAVELEALTFIFGNFFLTLSFFLLILSITSMVRISRAGESLRNAGDVSVFHTVKRWIRNRYGLEIAFERNLQKILANEELTVNYLSEDYYLTVTEVNGEQRLIVRNVHGEAPLKYT